MNWVSIAAAALGGGAGGAVGSALSSFVKHKNAKAVITSACAVLGLAFATHFLAPWAEIEYAFRFPDADMKTVLAMAPNHVDELKATLLAISERGGTTEEMRRASFDWGRKYSTEVGMTRLFSLQDDRAVLKAFGQYMDVSREIYAHDKSACYVWFTGVGTANPADLGISPAASKEIMQLMHDAVVARDTNAPTVKASPIDEAISNKISEGLKKNWDTSRLDLDAISNPKLDLPAVRKENGCYAAYALFSEVQALPENERLSYLRSAYGTR